MNLNNWFAKAMTSETYVKKMKKNKDNLLHIYNSFEIPDLPEQYAQIEKHNLRVIVLTEDWCGDAMLNVPILLRLSEKTNMEVRMLLRDENLDLMDQYLTNGKSRSIPIFIFIDQDGNEVAKWGPRSEYIQQFVDKLRAQLPHKDDEKYEEQFKETLSTTTKSFLERKDFWEDVHNSILEKLI